jgi:CBS domain-containing membrane protein
VWAHRLVALTALICRHALGESPSLPLVVAPLGASAVLLFAVPASPLAQRWPIIGGNSFGSDRSRGCAHRARPDSCHWIRRTGCDRGNALCSMPAPARRRCRFDRYNRRPKDRGSLLRLSFRPGRTEIDAVGRTGLIFHRFAGRTYPHRSVAAPEIRIGSQRPSGRRCDRRQARHGHYSGCTFQLMLRLCCLERRLPP